MGAELATIVAIRRTSTSGADDVGVITCTTPSEALRVVDGVLDEDPRAAAAVHVAELAPDAASNTSVLELVRSLAAAAMPGDVLVTDVVAQLCGRSGRRFSGRGHVRVAGRPMRVHVLEVGGRDRAAPTFGRAIELASLDWLVDELLAGSGRAVVIEGEAGIGKTHLTTEALGRAHRAGFLVARAASDELGRDRPGHLALALLDQLRQDASEPTGDDPTSGRGDHAFVDAFTAAIESRAQDRPLLVVGEDLHWADDLSLRAIGALARRLAPIAAALIVTFRPTPRPPLLAQLEAVLEGTGAEHHRLDPLDPEAITALVATLAGAPPGPRLRERLLTTAGNPLFVIEMLDALGHDDALDVGDGVVELDRTGGRLPDRLRETALRRIRHLPDVSVSLLRHAALLGSACELGTLSTVTSRSATSILADLAPAVEAGVLARSGDRIEFRHDVIREAIVGDLAPVVRRELHRDAGAALARGGAPPVQVARQLALGAQPGDPEPAEWLERAAAEVRPMDPAAAVDLLEEGLALAPPGWEGRDRMACAVIEPLTASGRVDEAIGRAEDVIAEVTDPELRMRAHLGLVSALSTRGDLATAAQVARRASAEPGVDPHRRLVLDCVTTNLGIFVDETPDEVRRVALIALDAAREGAPGPARDELACWATHALGFAALVDGRYAGALERFDESARLLEHLHITDHGFLIPNLNAGTAALYLDDWAPAAARLRAVTEHWAARGETGPLVICHFGAAAHAYVAGQWDDAVPEVEAGLSLAAETGADSMTVGLNALAALVHADQGRPDAADEHVERGFDVLARGAHLFGVDLLVLARVRRLEHAGATEEAAQLLVGLWDQAGHLALALQHRDVLPALVRCGGPMLGDRLPAVLAAADRAARESPVPSTLAAARRCRGLATGAVGLLLEAVDLARSSPRRVTLADTCEEAAAMLFAADRADEAAALVDEAVDIWSGVAATARIARIDALARANGIRRRRSRAGTTSHGWEALSPKELEVVELVADGLTNPMIGERLYISRRTVESHLSHVFAKLGLANRAQLAAAVVERRGRTRDP